MNVSPLNRHDKIVWTLKVGDQWQIHDFHEEAPTLIGGANLLFHHIIFKKLHENEEILVEKEERVPRIP